MDTKLKQEIISLIKEEMNCITEDVLPIGTIIPFPSMNPPIGWLICDGSYYPKEKFPVLSEVLAGTYAENGPLFRVPDLQGQFIRGLDLSGNVDACRQIGTFQPDAIQGHRHEFRQGSQTASSGGHSHSIGYDKSPTIGWSGDYSRVYELTNSGYRTYETQDGGYHIHDIPKGSVCDIIPSSFGETEGHVDNETRPKNIALLYCIKAEHLYGIHEFTQSDYNALLDRVSSDIINQSMNMAEKMPIVPKDSKEYFASIESIKESFFSTIPTNKPDLLLRAGRCFEAICIFNARIGEFSSGFDETGLYYLVCWMAEKGIIREQEKDSFKEEVKMFFRSIYPAWHKD